MTGSMLYWDQQKSALDKFQIVYFS